MSPRRIVEEAVRRGLKMAALTDHNSAENCPAFESLCRKRDITPLSGLEVTTREEVHVVCLFEKAATARDFGALIYELLPEVYCDPATMGDQVIVDEEENVIDFIEKHLITAAEIGFEQLYTLVGRYGGLFIPAHIDRPVFSVSSQLGFLPALDYPAVESVTWPSPLETGEIPVIADSDAHYPDDIAKRFTRYTLRERSLEGLTLALKTGSFCPSPLLTGGD